MANLFSLPTPNEVRANANRRLFNTLPQYGGGRLGGANQGAAAIGMGLGRLFGGASPEEQKAQAMQRIQQETIKELGGMPDISDIGAVSALGKKLARNLATGGFTGEAMQVMSTLSQLAPEDTFKEFKTEERKTASQAVKSINSRAGSIRGSYGKLERLNKQAKSSKAGSTEQRSAINSMIANVVRLNSPGIVSETELQTYTGGQSTPAALLAFLKGEGINVDAWSAGIDASGNADPDALLRIGQNLILAEASPLFDQYDDAKNRAATAKLSDRAQATIFGESKNLNALRDLTKKVATPTATGGNQSLDARAKALGL